MSDKLIGTPAHLKAMGRHGQIAEELGNSRVNSVAERIWREALTQPEFRDVSVVYGYAPMSSSDHRNGRCMDFMVAYAHLSRGQQVAMGDAIRHYFVKHHERLHVQGIIWNRHVTGFPGTRELGRGPGPHETYRGPTGEARHYTGDSPHTDHVHVQVSGETPRAWLSETIIDPNTGNPTNGDTMPTPEELWDWDHIDAPAYVSAASKKTNPTWRPKNVLKESAEQAHAAVVAVARVESKLDALIAALTPPGAGEVETDLTAKPDPS